MVFILIFFLRPLGEYLRRLIKNKMNPKWAALISGHEQEYMASPSEGNAIYSCSCPAKTAVQFCFLIKHCQKVTRQVSKKFWWTCRFVASPFNFFSKLSDQFWRSLIKNSTRIYLKIWIEIQFYPRKIVLYVPVKVQSHFIFNLTLSKIISQLRRKNFKDLPLQG